MINRCKALVAGLAFALAAGTASAQTYTIKISTPTINSLTEQWIATFKAAVEKRSDGKIKVQAYPASQLGPIPTTVEGTALGTIEIVAPASGFLAGLEPRFLVLEAPGIFDDLAHAHRVLQDPEIQKRFAGFGRGKGVEPLVVIAHGPILVLSHNPIRKVADFAGQKLRVPGAGPIYVEPMRQLGASPISMPLGEVLPAMQNKAIDGSFSGSAIFTSMKFYDIAKALTEIPSGIIAVGVTANSAFLKSLGPDLETIVREEARKAYAANVDWSLKDTADTYDVWRKNGGEIIAFPPEEKGKYLALVTSVLPKLLADNPALKEDYDALVAAAARQRR